ncbi:MAG: hypothetical protein QNK37_11910 [Acidobacteriota bacterium]|nr:hypothetical protein [Acidobacteriota bacterium]
MSKTVLFNITHGFQARMLLRTPIAERLIAEGCRIIVVSPNAAEPYFRQEFEKDGFHLELMPHKFSKLEGFLIKTRQYLLMNPSLGGTLNYKREAYRRKSPFRAGVIRTANLFLGNIPVLRKTYTALERVVFNGREWDQLLARTQPDLVVAGTPGFNPNDIHLLRAARRLKIPTVTVMLSWDNLTSKGYMGAYPDRLLVWSPLMAEEARHYHDYTGPIHEVGAAQFDIYAEVDKQRAAATFRREHGMDEDTRLLVWGTINQAIYPDQLDDLKGFIEAMSRRTEKIKLWIRLHPQTISGPFKHMKESYEQLASDMVHVEFPPVRSEKLAWDLPKEDMLHLARLLAAADVVVIPRSTLSIDAACARTPVINVAVNPQFAKGFNYTHYAKLLKCNGVRVMKDFDELERTVTAYLADPAMDAEGRAAIVMQQLGVYYGRAAQRTAEVLSALARGEEPEPAEALSPRQEPAGIISN